MLAVFYKQNKELMFKKRADMDFDIAYGGWTPPTCCSLLINILQWFFTYKSVLLNKGDRNAYWLPELIRADLSGDFYAVQDQNDFWKFMDQKFAEYIFSDKIYVNQDTKEPDTEMLKNFSNETLS